VNSAGSILSVAPGGAWVAVAGERGGVTDDRELAGLDPFTRLDTEAGRLDAFLSGLGEADWQRASRAQGGRYGTCSGISQRVRTITKVKSPLSRWNKADPHRPARSAPVTAMTLTISVPEATPQSATRPDRCLIAAPGL
jgi:hypothetical protein